MIRLLAVMFFLQAIAPDVCPLGTTRIDLGYCVVPMFTFGARGIQLWQPDDWDWSGEFDVRDVQLLVNQVLAGGATITGPATLSDVQHAINKALTPLPAPSPGTAGALLPLDLPGR